MGRPTKIKVGDRYGRLTVVGVQSFGSGKHAAALCDCDCGNKTSVKSHLLFKIKSCGCSQYDSAFRKVRGEDTYPSKSFGEAMFNSFFSSYKNRAKRHDQLFTLSKDDFRNIISKNCEYCGAVPRKRMVHKKDGSPLYNGEIYANGIDRVNNNDGYTVLNSVACCSECNFAKHTRDKEQFFEHCLSVVKKQFTNLLKE
jgi:hypothetical protein